MTNFEKIKKAALARLDAGEDLEHILQDYADYEVELRPVLEEALGVPLADLMQQPAEKPKNKAKRDATPRKRVGSPALVLLILLLLGLLGVASSYLQFVPDVTEAMIAYADPCATVISVPQTLDYNQGATANMPTVLSGVAPAGAAGSDGAAETYEMGAADTMTASPLPTMVAEESESLRTADTATGSSAAPVQVQQAQPLRAGEIDDNVTWDDYQSYRRTYLDTYGNYQVRDVDVSDRQIIQVVDREGHPVMGACVQIFIGQDLVTESRTYATGMTMFFPNLRDKTRYVDQFRVVVTQQGMQTETVMNRESVTGVVNISLDLLQNIETKLDVLFLLDSTGSMGDEIAQLQDNILTIADQIHALQGNVDVRYGLVAYRDFGDEYVTRMYDFTSDVNSFRDSLSAVRANGGGDYPEAMNEALDMALNGMNWRQGDTVKLVFLVADAPPQIGITQADYSLLMQDALARGIKIHPIASSGLQPEGEYVMRQIGQFTMGHFIFLTYEEGVSGTPGDERPDLSVGDPEDAQGVGDYSVSQLDEMVMRLIRDELNALHAQ